MWRHYRHFDENGESIVPTNFPDKERGKAILESIFGQMSDGIWEESNRITGYYVYAKINKDDELVVLNRKPLYMSGERCSNPYDDKTDDEIRAYFANKIKQIVRLNLNDNYEEAIYQKFKEKYGIGHIKCLVEGEENIKKSNLAYEEAMAYIDEHPFRLHFNDKDNTPLEYLNPHWNKSMVITVADAYRAYKSLIDYNKDMDKTSEIEEEEDYER